MNRNGGARLRCAAQEFLRALRCFSSQQAKPRLLGAAMRGPAAQGRNSFSDALRPDFATLDSLCSSRAKRSSQALALVSWGETGKGYRVESHRPRKKRTKKVGTWRHSFERVFARRLRFRECQTLAEYRNDARFPCALPRIILRLPLHHELPG